MNKFSKKIYMSGFLFVILLITISSINCSRENKTLAEIGDEKITLGEYEKQYLRTMSVIDSAKMKTIDERRQFLNLYINFRLKVKDARDRGLLNNPEIQKETEEYKKNFAPSYLVNKEVAEDDVKKLYERKKEEVRASHILINLAEHPSLQDSITAYQKADSIIQKLKNGEDFGKLADLYSEDRTVRQSHGDLYYFTAGMTVDNFEDAVYDMKVGEFTKKPIRTVFGLHIIKLTDRKPRFESIKASHILIQDKRDSLGKLIDSVQTYQKALEVYNRAKNGEDFTSLATQFSEDPGTKQNGGDLGYFDRRRMTQPFDSVVFNMKVGEIAGPVRTQYGWHIIKKTDEKKMMPYEKQKESILSEYKKTKKFKDSYQAYIDKLKAKYGFKIDDAGFAFFRSKFDSSKTLAEFNLDSLFSQQEKERIVAAFNDGQVKISDIINHLNINRDFQRRAMVNETLINIVNSAAEQSVLNKRAAESGIEKDDEFKRSMEEYENGLLVFRVDQDELWTKVKINDNDMMSYYTANSSKYTKLDSTGQKVPKTFDEVKAEISNDLQQAKFKEIEKAYLDGLKQKYPVKIHEDVLLDAFKD